jgi:hypothetical protein
MGIGDWGLGIGDWGFGPQPPIPNPQSPIPIYLIYKQILKSLNNILFLFTLINNKTNKNENECYFNFSFDKLRIFISS